MIRRIPVILFFIIISASLVSAAANTVVITSVKGNVQYREGAGAWNSVSEGMNVPLGAVISTGFKSEAVIDLGNSEILVKQLTRMSIKELSENNKTVKTDLNLRLGRIQADVKTSEGLKHDFTIRTPVSTAAVRGTRFSFDGVNIKVENGRVVVSNKNNHSASYRGGESGSFSGNTPPSGGLTGRESDLRVSSDTGDILSGSGGIYIDTTGAGSVSGVEYGSVKINWTYSGS